MRQYYHISKSIRVAATKAQLYKRWFSTFQDPVIPNSLFSADFRYTRRGRYSALETGRDPPFSLHGNGKPEYLALDLYIHPFSAEGRMLENMDDALNDFTVFAIDHPVFKTLRRVDFLVIICEHQRERAMNHVKEVVDCINSQWERQGVHDGMVRVWWEIVPSVDELGPDELRDMLEVYLQFLGPDELRMLLRNFLEGSFDFP